MSAAVVATRSRMPYVVLAGIALAIAAGLWASGLGADILRYRKDIVYLTKQHLVLVAVSGSAAIVFGIAAGIWLSRPWMARWAEAAIQAINMVTSIPTLGKLALMMRLLGIGAYKRNGGRKRGRERARGHLDHDLLSDRTAEHEPVRERAG